MDIFKYEAYSVITSKVRSLHAKRVGDGRQVQSSPLCALLKNERTE